MNVDKWLETVKQCKPLSEKDMKAVSRAAIDIMLEEENVPSVSAPVSICGDIHGQFYDLKVPSLSPPHTKPQVKLSLIIFLIPRFCSILGEIRQTQSTSS